MKEFSFKINGNPYQVQVHQVEEQWAKIEVNGTVYEVLMEKKVPVNKTPKLVRGKTPRHSGDHKPLNKKRVATIQAPLPGTITEIHVKEGDVLKRDQLLLLMEAMKMENRILAEGEATVKAIKVEPGENVLQGQVLIELE